MATLKIEKDSFTLTQNLKGYTSPYIRKIRSDYSVQLSSVELKGSKNKGYDVTYNMQAIFGGDMTFSKDHFDNFSSAKRFFEENGVAKIYSSSENSIKQIMETKSVSASRGAGGTSTGYVGK